MRILADENIPGSVIRDLRRRGHDVLSVKESMRGQSDRAVLEKANRDERLVVTHDKGFGELAFHLCLPAKSGIVLLSLPGRDPESDCRRAVAAVLSRDDWTGHFAVVSENRIRIRSLPPEER